VKAVYSDTTGAPHTFTGPGWNSGAMSASGEASYTYRFMSTGTFDFYCSYHRSLGMTGTVTVT
jgi:plastocyanin